MRGQDAVRVLGGSERGAYGREDTKICVQVQLVPRSRRYPAHAEVLVHPLDGLIAAVAAHHQGSVRFSLELWRLAANFPAPRKVIERQDACLKLRFGLVLDEERLRARHPADLRALLVQQPLPEHYRCSHREEAHRERHPYASRSAPGHIFRSILTLPVTSTATANTATMLRPFECSYLRWWMEIDVRAALIGAGCT